MTDDKGGLGRRRKESQAVAIKGRHRSSDDSEVMGCWGVMEAGLLRGRSEGAAADGAGTIYIWCQRADDSRSTADELIWLWECWARQDEASTARHSLLRAHGQRERWSSGHP